MTYISFRSKLDPLYKYLNLLKVDDIYKLEIGKIMHEMHAGIPPDNFKQPFTPLNQIHSYPMQPVVLHEERSFGKQQKINTEKDL